MSGPLKNAIGQNKPLRGRGPVRVSRRYLYKGKTITVPVRNPGTGEITQVPVFVPERRIFVPASKYIAGGPNRNVK